MKNRAHRKRYCESKRLINKELSNLWKVSTPEGDNISYPFMPEDLATALNHQKPRKYMGLDYTFLEFIPTPRGASLGSVWLS